jgi:SNF2 family DNA or RNA helicase
MDEAHKIRNPDGQMAIYARRLHAPLRWAVTGTPLVNEWRDVVSLLAFLGVPCSPLWRWEDHLTDVLPHLVLHRSLEALRGILTDAPPYPIVEHMKLPFLTEKEREFYLSVQSAEMASPEDHLTSQEAFLLILRLRQISVHPQVYIQAKRRENRRYPRPDWNGPSTKLVALRDILLRDDWSTPVAEPHKYIIFCQFKEEMELIHEYLDSLELFASPNILEYDGSLTQEQRERVLTHSKKATEPTALLLQLQAGGVGLNLQECDRIIFISPWWTSALMDQAIARAVRMGQKRVVRVYHLEGEAEETEENTIFIDHMIDQKAEEKRGMLRDLFALCEALKAQADGAEQVEEVEAEAEEVEEEEVEPGQE